MTVVCNASPLMYLAKLGKIGLLSKLFGTVLVPEQVWTEVVVQGRVLFALEVRAVELAQKQGWIRVEKIVSVTCFPEIDEGEAAVIQLVLQRKVQTVLIDDAAGRAVASAHGLNVRGTLFVLLESCKKGLISPADCEELMYALTQRGFRVSVEVYTTVLREIREIKK